MARYIDADAIHYVEIRKGVEIALASDIDKIPTISPDEVRGVVRCGECKFWRRPPSCEGMARCETGETGIRYRSKNDFCSRGAKMKGAEENHTMDEFMYGQEMGSHSDGSL